MTILGSLARDIETKRYGGEILAASIDAPGAVHGVVLWKYSLDGARKWEYAVHRFNVSENGVVDVFAGDYFAAGINAKNDQQAEETARHEFAARAGF